MSTYLVKDLFFALGYDDLQLGVQRSGRGIYVQGRHRLELRRLVADCKAYSKKSSGAEVCEFFRMVARERSQDRQTPVTGYFVSLNGFLETAREWEEEMPEPDRVILLDGGEIIQAMVRIRILVGQADAAMEAGRCAEYAGLKDAALDGMELLGYETGYLWAVYFSRGKERTHFALIHANGTPVAKAVAQDVIWRDQECSGMLASLQYLAQSVGPDREELAAKAMERYRQWVVAECGEIQLDGLPADTDLSSVRLKLERLFVPLKLLCQAERGDRQEPGTPGEPNKTSQPRPVSVGKFLSGNARFSLLAKPGGGKSTLLKRLAVAYAAPERRSETDDELPEKDWLPLFLRCRELRDRAHRPICELLEDLPQHAGMSEAEAREFRAHMDKALRSGGALLLVDGLDELSDEGTRTLFANHLRTGVITWYGSHSVDVLVSGTIHFG